MPGYNSTTAEPVNECSEFENEINEINSRLCSGYLAGFKFLSQLQGLRLLSDEDSGSV